MKRPDLLDIKTEEELRQWYWLKAELVAYCKAIKISYVGNKAEITDRIARILTTGIVEIKKTNKKGKPNSNWAKEILTLETIITDSYKNGTNTRNFFKKQLDEKFKFNIVFMDWMKANCGKTLKDAVEVWLALEARKKNKNFKSTIPTSNQYNQYMRDFFADNPDKTIKDARKYWLLKRSLSGSNKYERADLKLSGE
ncbi:MAG: DUF6434 domain-containing protein [Saprospiraceae bacterium]